MDLEELMAQAGISKDDLKAFVSPLIKEAIGEELKGEIQDTVRAEVTPIIQALPEQVNAFVSQQVSKLAEEVKSEADKKLDKALQTAGSSNSGSKEKGKSEITPELKEKLLNRFIDKALGADEDKLGEQVEKLVKRQQALNTAMSAAGIYQPGPEVVWKAYQDATAKAYASMIRGGGFPLPVKDDTSKKVLSSSSPQSKSRGNSSKRSGVFDRFLR
ncbi:hypothetical protein ES708_11873 [subsurface metagenome]